ncbi:MAG: acetoin utilization protein AcuC [Actinomycetota bacterium]
MTVDDAAKAYDFGASHPLRPERVLLTYENIERVGLGDGVVDVAGRVATDEEIERVHDPGYVATVRGIDEGTIEEGRGMAFGLGTPDDPIFSNMHGASAAVCGASIAAAEAVATGRVEHCFNPAGGLHHARRREASGFCIYNDPAAAIAAALAMEADRRVMYVDVDVHHGDGVQWIFYEDPRVLTVSFHESGHYLYPGTGADDEIGVGDAVGTAANIPLPPYTGNSDYLWALEQIVPALAEAFRPHLMVTQLGGDTHHGDPLADLGLTLRAYPEMARILHDTAHTYAGGRWVATGGGGYQAETIVPKIWTIHFAEMCGRPDAIPEEWLRDLEPEEVSRSDRSAIETSVRSVLGACVPRLSSLASV